MHKRQTAITSRWVALITFCSLITDLFFLIKKQTKQAWTILRRPLRTLDFTLDVSILSFQPGEYDTLTDVVTVHTSGQGKPLQFQLGTSSSGSKQFIFGLPCSQGSRLGEHTGIDPVLCWWFRGNNTEPGAFGQVCECFAWLIIQPWTLYKKLTLQLLFWTLGPILGVHLLLVQLKYFFFHGSQRVDLWRRSVLLQSLVKCVNSHLG